MLRAIDHFIVAVPQPDGAAAELETSLGLSASAGGRHEAYGSFNRLIWLGDTYIELLGIANRDLAARAWFGSQALKVLDTAGAGYVGMSFVADDLEGEMAALHGQGSTLGMPQAGERHRADGGVVRWKVATTREPDPELGHIFLIEHDTSAAEWSPADSARRAAQRHPAGGPLRLIRVELPVHDLRATTMRLHRDVGLAFRPSLAGQGARDTSVGEQLFRLTRAGPGGLPRVVLRGGTQSRDVVALGVHWTFEA